MHDVLRDRILRHLAALPDERLYQVLDYIEFLSSKYARDQVRPPASGFQRFGERLEDRLRGHRVGFGAIRGTLGMVGTADRVVTGLSEMGRSVLRELGGAANDPEPRQPAPPERQVGPAADRPARPEDLPTDG